MSFVSKTYIMKVNIRLLTEEDIPSILEVISLNFEKHLPAAEIEIPQFLEKQQDSDASFLVAEINEQIVGCVGYHAEEDKDVKDVYWACWFYIHPNFQKKGIGSFLWLEMEKRVKLSGARKLYLDVGNEEDQPAAIKFYLNRGYVKEGELIDYFDEGENKQIFAKRM